MTRRTPPSRRPSAISSLAAAMFSRLPRCSRWEEPTLVTTAISGRTAAVMAEISPRLLMPISSTAPSASAGISKKERGKPMVLL